ncbi:SDR family NAD(P)-dependent oxidoreductase [Desertihabitans brevis]|uniref:SDR family NAD(P)-dependent oxidoreductase n=1 Tax=Desertihabitans brevis TaxID=2268447 RepID=UPI001314A6F3|nr:SDR family NAD(P)-dependent oxidoreductase [Desertihabitans brevis]
MTGASSGIGAEAARQLRAEGFHVAVVGRSEERTCKVADEVAGEAFLADFESVRSVEQLAASLTSRYATIDVLASNAGAAFAERRHTADGHERTWQVNVLSPALLADLLLPALLGAGQSRVIFTASNAHKHARLNVDDLASDRRRYSMMAAYSRSKLGTLVIAQRLADKVPPSSVAVSTFHPGLTRSDAFRDKPVLKRLTHARLLSRFTVSSSEAAKPLVHLATMSSPSDRHGQFYDRVRFQPQNHPQLHDDRVRDAVDRSIGDYAALLAR